MRLLPPERPLGRAPRHGPRVPGRPLPASAITADDARAARCLFPGGPPPDAGGTGAAGGEGVSLGARADRVSGPGTGARGAAAGVGGRAGLLAGGPESQARLAGAVPERSGTMICVAVTYVVLPNREEEAIDLFTKMTEASLQEPGCRMYQLHRSRQESRR